MWTTLLTVIGESGETHTVRACERSDTYAEKSFSVPSVALTSTVARPGQTVDTSNTRNMRPGARDEGDIVYDRLCQTRTRGDILYEVTSDSSELVPCPLYKTSTDIALSLSTNPINIGDCKGPGTSPQRHLAAAVFVLGFSQENRQYLDPILSSFSFGYRGCLENHLAGLVWNQGGDTQGQGQFGSSGCRNQTQIQASTLQFSRIRRAGEKIRGTHRPCVEVEDGLLNSILSRMMVESDSSLSQLPTSTSAVCIFPLFFFPVNMIWEMFS
ncbi:hypothetical protein RRG08_017729 [Elysia crispata]|uniref:Uncharacterized protein n=1 Tax=Elysia crispata TaxID=231223 RepID=A0AAE0XQT1_9GAST|nr:hypothetical protein RRG08_017729 [Elysia crispata]